MYAVLRFKLKEFLDQYGVSAYRLAQEIEGLEEQTIFAYARGSRNPSLKSLGLVILALERILDKRVDVGELLEVIGGKSMSADTSALLTEQSDQALLEEDDSWVLVPLAQQDDKDEEALEGELVAVLPTDTKAHRFKGPRGFRRQGFALGLAASALVGMLLGSWLPRQLRSGSPSLRATAAENPARVTTPVLIGPEGIIQSETPTLRVTSRADAERYEFYVRSTRSDEYLLESIASPTPQLIVEEGLLEPGDRYTWTARIWNENGWSSFASPLTFIVDPLIATSSAIAPTTAVPSPPESAERPIRFDSLTPTLEVEPLENVGWYGFYVRDLVNDALIYDNDYADGPSVTLPEGLLQPGASYRWNARARNEAGWGEFGERIYFVTSSDATVTEAGEAPVLEGMDGSPTTSSEVLALTLIGQGFVPGTRIFLTAPSGTRQFVPPGRTTYRGKGAVEVLTVLEEAGIWRARAVTLNGLESNEITFEVSSD